MAKRFIRILILEGAGCGGCALEARSALTKRYGAAGRGIAVVETPAHADVLVVCGPTPGPLAEEVRRLGEEATFPWTQVRLGDCAREEGPGILVAGCPPAPEAILAAVEAAWEASLRGRRSPNSEEQR